MKKIGIVASILAIAISLLVGCSQKTTPQAKGKEPYSGPKVTYTADVAPLIDRSCSPCHFPERRGRKEPLDSYDHMKTELAEVLERVQLDESSLKFMPYEKKKQPLSEAEIELLKNWARGGFLE